MPGRDRITPEGKRFLKQIAELAKLEVRVGFQAGAAASDDGVDMVDIAAWNELGTAHSPPRPFLRQSVDNNEAQIVAMCKAQVRAIVKGATAQVALQTIGAMQKGHIQKEIKDGGFIENAPITIEGGWMKNKKSGKPFYVEGKKSAQPLIDSGRMRQSVNFVIQEKGAD
jgi:hypothetical protein